VPAPGEETDNGVRLLGKDPATGLDVTVRSGRFGPYVQLGEGSNGEKPKRTALPKGTDPAAVDLAIALKLLALPREVGRHPETGEPIVVNIGRYGPYVLHGKTYANLERGDDVLALGLNRAVTLIAEKALKGGRGRRAAAPGRVLGEHPEKGGEIVAREGRYGPYVSHSGVNATLPAGKTPDTVTLDEAVPLIDARASRGAPAKRRAPRKKAAAKPAAAQGEAKPRRKAAKAAKAAE
jgi:DNA topoisomerase-1